MSGLKGKIKLTSDYQSAKKGAGKSVTLQSTKPKVKKPEPKPEDASPERRVDDAGADRPLP